MQRDKEKVYLRAFQHFKQDVTLGIKKAQAKYRKYFNERVRPLTRAKTGDWGTRRPGGHPKEGDGRKRSSRCCTTHNIS